LGGARVGAAYEWVKHEPVARKAGVATAVIEAIRTGHEPPGLDGLQQAALAAAQCVLKRRSIPRVVQDELAAALGLAGVWNW